uniref:WRKY19-like zinc finger domain-containing protein n=1 Tax=Globisporangium ultimum (strain ATCC 200006 / CBS 805.95 / DAOM BR144) TaxID=431595 RepID=K3WMP7_GLOUD
MGTSELQQRHDLPTHGQQRYFGNDAASFQSHHVAPRRFPTPEHQSQSAAHVDQAKYASLASSAVQYMDVDQFDGPEGASDDRRSPMSPGALDLSYHEPEMDAERRQQHGFPLPALSHFQSVMTQVSRFKQAHGYAPETVIPSPSNGIARSASFGSDSGIRLPSFTGYPGTPPLSPRVWASSTTSSPCGDALPSPLQRGFPLTTSESIRQVFPTNNRVGFAAPPPFTLAPIRPHNGLESPTLSAKASPTKALPSLAALATSLPRPDDASFPHADKVGGPFPYHRSASCPSDAMTRSFKAGDDYSNSAQEPAVAPYYLLNPASVPRGNLVRSNSVDAQTAFTLRSRSMLAPSETHATQQWLEPIDRQASLSSLADSAHALLLEQQQSHSPSSSSGPSSPLQFHHPHTHRLSEDEGEEAFFSHGVSHSNGGAASTSDAFDGRREKKLCSFPECTSNAVTRGKCISHGGGRRCQKKGCTRGAQSKGLCVAHGGGRICRERGCSNIQRSMGLCIRHGGGKRCSMAGCQKGVVRQDLCTAHGGKRKCRVDDCTKHVKKRGLCRSHANSMLYAAAAS